jgi:cell division protein DivIC
LVNKKPVPDKTKHPISMKLLNHIPAWLKNKYFIAFASFVVIMLFMDKNDLFTTMARNKELRELKESRIYYSNEIQELTTVRDNLMRDPKTIEKYAREKYLMKRDNEDLFVIQD